MQHYALQRFLLDTMDHYGGASIDLNICRLVCWLLNALVNGPVEQGSVAGHGHPLSAFGPYEFLKQCEVLTTTPNYEG